MLISRVPLAVTSVAMRHSTLRTTTKVYGHPLCHVAHDAVDVIADALNEADVAFGAETGSAAPRMAPLSAV